MDLSFKTPDGRFNYRVCGIIIRDGRLLAMQDGISAYSYLPGGRVQFNETAEAAILREIREEMKLEAHIIRPLWLSQSFFTEDTGGERFHEICIYYLLEVPGIPDRDFTVIENGRRNHFEWFPFGELKEKYLYPEFIGERIGQLPKQIEMIVENHT